MVIRLGSAAAVQRFEFLSNSRDRRNACARGARIWRTAPAFVFCENIPRFYAFNQQYLKPDFV
jgi:hypothetical protein